ncbi:hypothetical protein [Dokdonella sp.]|uniref:hypothetical protein n=1 Tax=Dokdonella sp. TaxID=2291710 RepID=UPI001B050153|nr:hypothetical protein [Dokdonella sp.]MBO9663542.1 hypothetical protein [Dokdonella sp.]
MKPSSLFAVGALALCTIEPVRGAEFWVGSGESCDFSSIEEAIAAAQATPEADTIRIAKNQVYSNQALSLNTSLTLVGGYPLCGAAERDGYTSLEGTTRNAVLAAFSGDPDGIEVHLDRLDISRGGESNGVAHRGGISISGNVHVFLRDSVVRNNYSGGGGGIGVRGPRAILTIEAWVDIRENTTYGNGGGILINGGALNIRPHGVTIKQNRANLNGKGGGIAVVNGGSVSESTDPFGPLLPVEPVRILQNYGARGGGGAYVAGVNSLLLASEIIVDENTSDDGHGGGILVETQGYAQLSGFPDPPFRACPPGQECLSLSGNSSTRSGAALAVRGGGSARIDGAIVRRNLLLGSEMGGNAFLIDDTDSSLRLANSVVADNSCDLQILSVCSVVDMIAGPVSNRSKFWFAFTTFAHNGPVNGALISTTLNGRPEGGIVLDASSSLIGGKRRLFEYRGPVPWPVAQLTTECLLKDQGDPDPFTEVGGISFQDQESGDYRLRRGSVAIDYCSHDSAELDLHRQPRGIDDPERPNRDDSPANTFDLGAYEFHAVYDRIFADGFESAPPTERK